MVKRILAVEDSPTVRQLIKMTLLDYDYDVADAKNGAEAMTKVEAADFDLVITDINMPVMGGMDFLRACRAHPRGGDVPVLVLTTEVSDSLKAEARAAGATGWLSKPFQQHQLVDAVRKVIGP